MKNFSTPAFINFSFFYSAFLCLPLFFFAEQSLCGPHTFQQDEYVKDFLRQILLIHHSDITWQFGDGESDQLNRFIFAPEGATIPCFHYVKDSATLFRFYQKHCINFFQCTIEPKFEWRRDSLNCKRYGSLINQFQKVSVGFTGVAMDQLNDVNPAHVYNQPGSYNVCLTIEAGTIVKKRSVKPLWWSYLSVG
jgi:hypothetical protein